VVAHKLQLEPPWSPRAVLSEPSYGVRGIASRLAVSRSRLVLDPQLTSSAGRRNEGPATDFWFPANMISKRLFKRETFQMNPKPPFHFDGTFHKPSHFPAPVEAWEPGFYCLVYASGFQFLRASH
jgi:hypothetical protein